MMTIFRDRNLHSPQDSQLLQEMSPLRLSYYKKLVKQVQQYIHKLFRHSTNKKHVGPKQQHPKAHCTPNWGCLPLEYSTLHA